MRSGVDEVVMTRPGESGDMTAQVRAHDWAATPLGALKTWPERLRGVIELMLASPLLSSVAVGPDRLLIYNDAAARLYGDRHPAALGRPLAETFPESFTAVSPLYDRVFAGEAVTVPAQPLDVRDDGSGEMFDAYLTPVRGPDGAVIAAHMTGFEVGARLRDEQARHDGQTRQAFLLKLSDALRPLTDPAAIQAEAMRVLMDELGMRWAQFWEVDPRDEAYIISAEAYASGAPPLAKRQRINDFGQFVQEALSAGQDIVIDDARTDARLGEAERATYEAAGIRSCIGVPIMENGRFAGGLGVYHAGPHRWTGREIALAREVAERAWSAIKRAHVEAALAAAQRRQQVLVDGIPQLVWRADEPGRWTWASPQWTAFTGQAEPDSHGWGWLDCVHPDDRDAARKAWARAVEAGELEVEYRLLRDGDGYRWFQTRASPVRDVDGGIIEWLGTSTDIDDARHLQERQQMLLAELQHRVRNILTVVRSVFNRTAERSGDLEDLLDHFRGRLDALARTQVIVTQTMHGNVDLENLIRDELLSVGVGIQANDGVTVAGPDILLPSKAAESLGLAIHELTTNALKYGALKVPKATLEISWVTNLDDSGDARLDLIWCEQGVPAVPIPPSREGFGRELIEHALPYRLGAQTELEFRGGGVQCRISVPLAHTGEDVAAAIR